MPYEVVKLSQTTRTVPDGASEILDIGNIHEELRGAVVEATARQLATGVEGGVVDWRVVRVGDETRTPVEDPDCEPQDVYEYLVEHLGLAPEQAERLVE